jgi:hypothetical protein
MIQRFKYVIFTLFLSVVTAAYSGGLVAAHDGNLVFSSGYHN